MPFQKGNKLGTHRNHKSNFNPQQFYGTRWMQKAGMVLRVAQEQIAGLLADGWQFGRPTPSAETKRKQSEAHARNPNHPGYWKPGHKTWNDGDKMPPGAGIAMSAAKLEKYGVTREQVEEARNGGLSWCSEHLKFESNGVFTILKNGVRATRCQKSHKKYTSWYGLKLAEQRGLCAICGLSEPNDKALNTDHWHDCTDPLHTRKHEPKIGCSCSRGLLCSLCNRKLGHVESLLKYAVNLPDDSWEAKALAYLASYKTLQNRPAV